MFLKTLQIKGFKSFADTASLDLEPGVTVVVGPNGSGKSNVVDAIGWVLGAQAPSAVRSQKMDDVIFAGTSKRPALGRAEVSLTIDNSSGMLPIEFTEVTITRILFRSGDSEYLINGVPCRLLDIQELLSDSGVGRQQHVIISQGQIDAVLNARPEERRLIIEEAAGVLKFRRRKEKAERRLASTEANLTRILDMLREVKRQRGPLERQADAAARHGSVVAELSALKIHLAGRELQRHRAQLAASADGRRELSETERTLRASLAELDARILEIEAELSSVGGGDFSDALVRYESLRERARGLAAVLVERTRGIERDRDAFVDEAVVASLAVEQAELRADLDATDADTEAFSADLEALASAEAELAEARAAFDVEWADGAGAAVGAAEVRGELAALVSMAERSLADQQRLVGQHERATERVAQLRAELERVEGEHAEAVAATPASQESLDDAAAILATAETALASADEDARAAAAEHHRWAARAEALGQALDEARANAGADRLVGLDGVLGTVLDLIEVTDGAESAVEAALGDALNAVVVSDPVAGRRAVDALAGADLTGAVLALGVSAPGAGAGGSVPTSGVALRSMVRGTRPGVDALLDSLFAGITLCDGPWTEALDLAISHPDAVIVTRRGDRFSRRGWRVGAPGAGATGAAHDEALAYAGTTAEATDVARHALDRASEDVRAARAAHAERERAHAELIDGTRRLSEATVRLRRDLGDAAGQLVTVEQHRGEIDERIASSIARRSELEALLPDLEAAEAEVGERARRMAAARRELEAQAGSVAAMRNDVEVRQGAIEERRRGLADRMAQVDQRLSRNEAERRSAEHRHTVLEIRAGLTDRLVAIVASRLAIIDGVVGEFRDVRRAQSERTRSVSERLEALRRERATHERSLEELRERRQRSEIADAETRLRLETATESLRHELDTEPEVAVATPCPELADGVTAHGRVRELERDIKLMGPINPLALEEFAALTERVAFLEGQLEDIRSSRRELGKIISAVDEEIVSVFAAAYADVSANFDHLFQTLFPGGSGRLTLTEPGDLLNTGIELEARPSGKNVRKLSLLSGGERSLTALAYLFAVFRSRPSPFYVMDEVEAALDDINLHRFLGLVAEFRSAAQLLIVSHQKRTMEAADVLYGVTMEPGGSSRVISERVSSALD